MANRRKVTIYLPDLIGGGVPILYLKLAPWLIKAGFDISFLVNKKRGELADSIPPGIEVIELGASRQLTALPKLVRFLRANQPDLILTAIEHMHVITILARLLVRPKTRHVMTQHNPLSQQAMRPGLDFKVLPLLYRLTAPFANAIVAVSKGVGDDMAKHAHLRRDRIQVIYNGVVDEHFDDAMNAPLPANWPQTDAPIILNIGRLAAQKDQRTLLRALAKLNGKPEPHLVILGSGPLEQELRQLAVELGIDHRLHLLGYSDAPLAALKAADIFVLSSIYEGLGLVLIESLACGTPVVSTNCPYGPEEILDGGKYGRLTPVGDADALARAIEETLSDPPDPAVLSQRGREFSVEHCAQEYAELFDRVLTR